MRSSFDAVDNVFARVKSNISNISVYKLNKPDTVSETEYIAVNSLPVTCDILQIGIANINIHVKDIEPGKVNTTRLKSLTASVLALFPYTNNDKCTMFLDSSSTGRNENLSESYSNIRVKVVLLN